MEILISGLVLFFGIHIVPSLQSVRGAMVAKLGENGYRGVFSLISVLGLGLIIWGKGQAGYIDAYDPPEWGRFVPLMVMLPALIAVVASHMKGHIRLRLGDAMSWGVGLWAASHLMVNGDLASVLIFGAFLLYAIVDIVFDNERVEGASYTPRGSQDVIAIIVGVILFVALAYFHETLFGVPVAGFAIPAIGS